MSEIKKFNLEKFKHTVYEYSKTISSEMISWVVILLLHSSTIPTLIAVMSGLSDQMPPLDLTLMIWAALSLLFVKAVIKQHRLNILTIGLGFIVQSTLMALIFFK